MPWFQVDDQFPTHPGVLATSLEARGLWATAGAWSSAHLTDGVVPDHVLALLGSTPELEKELVTAGMWRRNRGAIKFTGVTEKIPTKEAVETRRKGDAERQRRSREGKLSRRDSRVTNGVSHGVSHSALTGTSFGSTNGRARAAPRTTKIRPAWCGQCTESTRQIDTQAGPARCPRCHPLADGIEARAWKATSRSNP